MVNAIITAIFIHAARPVFFCAWSPLGMNPSPICTFSEKAADLLSCLQEMPFQFENIKHNRAAHEPLEE